MTKLLIVILLAASFFSAEFLSDIFAKDLPPHVSTWLKKYASPSAFQARIKNMPDRLRPSEANIKKVLTGKTRLELDPPLRDGSKLYDIADAMELTSSRKLEVIDWATQQMLGAPTEEAFEAAERNKKMLQVMEDLVRGRPKDQLILIDVGGLHALDLFFNSFLKNPEDQLSKRKNEIAYFFTPVKSDTELKTPEYRKLFEMIRGVEEPRNYVKDVEVPEYLFLLSRMYFYNQLARGAFTYERLMKEDLGAPGVLVFMDHHGLNSTEALDQLPSAAEWKAAGFKSILVATEEFMAGKDYSLIDYSRLFLVTDTSPVLERAETKIKAWAKKTEIVSLPAQKALYKKLSDYQKSDLKVSVTGLESREHLERLKVVEPKEDSTDIGPSE